MSDVTWAVCRSESKFDNPSSQRHSSAWCRRFDHWTRGELRGPGILKWIMKSFCVYTFASSHGLQHSLSWVVETGSSQEHGRSNHQPLTDAGLLLGYCSPIVLYIDSLLEDLKLTVFSFFVSAHLFLNMPIRLISVTFLLVSLYYIKLLCNMSNTCDRKKTFAIRALFFFLQCSSFFLRTFVSSLLNKESIHTVDYGSTIQHKV